MALTLWCFFPEYPFPNNVVLKNVEIAYGAPPGMGGPAKGEPATATFEVYGLTSLDDIRVNDDIGIFYDDGSGQIDRFYGNVYDVEIIWSSVDRHIHRVAAAGPLARVTRALSSTNFTLDVENDAERFDTVLSTVTAIINESIEEITWDADPGTVQLAAVTDPSGTYEDILDQIALSGMGLVTDSPSGVIKYHDRRHVQNQTPALVLDASQILNDISIRSSSNELINSMSIGYGPTDERATVTAEEWETSIDVYGYFPASYDSLLNNQDDALDLAAEYLYRYSVPRWSFPTLRLDSRLTPDILDQIQIGALVLIQGLPQPGPSQLFGVIQHYREIWANENQWQIEIDLANLRDFGGGIIWDNIDPDTTWDDLNTDYLWSTISDAYDPVNVAGSWSTAPANVTYANAPTTAGDPTWNDWNL